MCMVYIPSGDISPPPGKKEKKKGKTEKKEIPMFEVNSAIDLEGSREERCTCVMFKCPADQPQVFKSG